MTYLSLKQIFKEEPVKEFNPLEKYFLAVDMDGVLVHFEKGALSIINDKRQDIKKNMRKYSGITPDNRNKDYLAFKFAKKIAGEIGWDGEVGFGHLKKEDIKVNKLVRNMLYMLIGRNKDHWANLDWAPGGQELWSFVSPYSPYILSSPMINDPDCEEGKRIWCKKHLGLEGNRVIIVQNKGIDLGNKKVGILIDDKATKLAEFGGMGILHKTGDAKASIDRLKELGFK